MKTSIKLRTGLYPREMMKAMGVNTDDKVGMLKGETATLPDMTAELVIAENEVEEVIINLGGVTEFAFPLKNMLTLLQQNGYQIVYPNP